MSHQEQWDAVDTYIGDLFVGSDDALEQTLATSDAAGLPAIQVAPNQGKLLQMLARSIGARRILEIGTLGGYSTIWLARALPPAGNLVTLEVNEDYAKVARKNLERAGVSDCVDVRVGPAAETLPTLEGPFDLIFIDANKDGYPEYLEWSLRLSRPGSLIVADNVVREGHVLDEGSDDANIQGTRRFNELLAREPRVTATVIQTVGTKGYDGLAFALVVR